ncbi:MAG: Ig-like domain-containing protein [Candidatus Limnocylindria bacterium]
MRVVAARGSVFLVLALLTAFLAGSLAPAVAQTSDAVTIVAPDDGEILDGTVTLRANVSGATASSVEFFYDPHEDDEPEISLGLATFDTVSGHWVLDWDTRAVADTFNDIDTDGDGVEDTTVNLTKPPTHDQLRVAAATDAGPLGDAIDVRVQNMLTVRFTLPDNQEDLRGFQDLEAVLTSEFEVTNVRFDLYDFPADADPRLPTSFGEFETLGEPIENPHYGRPLGDPAFPLGDPTHVIGEASPSGPMRWVLRGWDTTTIPDGTWLLVATAEDAGGGAIAPRRATYMVETYIVNDLRVKITAPDPGDTVSRFVALEARTSSLTGADNAAPGSLWPATSVVFTIGTTDIPATETPSGSGRWRAVWDGDSFAPGPYTITATATNANPSGAETAVDSINVNLVAPGADLEAFFPFDWSNCTLQVCSFLDGSSGGPTSWFWEFGDGNTSTDQLPTHTYANYGVYTVRLTVSNDGGVTTDTYERVIPVGNTGVVSFNRNDLDLEGATEFIDWTSAFKNFNYEVGSTLAIPVMWETTVGSADFVSAPTTVCDDDEDTSNQECVIFTPEEALGTAPTVVGAAEDGVLLTLAFTQVQFRGVTDIFKGKANLRVAVGVDLDGDGLADQENQLGTNVDVTNSGVEGDEARVVKIISPFEGQFVGGIVPVSAGVVSSVAANEVEFFVGTDSIGVDTNGANAWTASWDTTTLADGSYQLTAVARFGDPDAGGIETTSAVRTVNVENTLPQEPPAPDGTFQIGRTSDTLNKYITYPHEIEETVEEGAPGGGGPPDQEPTIDSSATAVIVEDADSPVVLPDASVIGGDVLEFDLQITNNSPDAVLTAYAFQSKFSESPALASRIGDKAFYGVLVPGVHPDGPMVSVKKNGTANGLFSGRWKGICINSAEDFLPEFNSGLEDESLECAGNRADTDFDGQPEIQTGSDIRGLYPGESQTVRVRIEAGTTDGALHVVQPGTLRGRVVGTEVTGPNGLDYFVPTIDNTGITDPNVVAIPDFGDNKVLRDADGTFNPTFAPKDSDGDGPDVGYDFAEQQYLTFPRVNFAFTDILGRNHTCETYGLDHLLGIPCSGNPTASPAFGLMGVGDLLPGVQNLAAILHGFGEYAIDENGDPILDENGDYIAPNFPYDTPCVNPNAPDGLRCGARPFTPIAEFYKANGDGSVTQQMVAGSYGELGSAGQYTATIAAATAEDVKEEIIPEPEPGGPCDPVADPDSRKPSCAQLRTNATAYFHDLVVEQGTGINGGDVAQFTIDVTNLSSNPDAYLTAFNYQTKERNLADIGGLDGFTQDRRDIRVDSTLPLCGSLADGACYNASLGIGHFPNVIGNGLLFGQMVWPDNNIDRAGQEIISDLVHVDPATGIEPTEFGLESVKKNGPFTPILKGNTNFICVKSGLFEPDPDADAACAGDPAILEPGAVGDPIYDPDDETRDNIEQRLGLAPGQTQSVRIRMEWGDFRGALLEVVAGATLNLGNVDPAYAATDGLARFFDCSDQRELEFCHPFLVGENIGYLPNTNATWLTPATLDEIEYVIINQPGDAARIMNFQENLGHILAMAGFGPSAEFYAPDPNPELIGTPDEGILIRQQVLGSYGMTDVAAAAPVITSTAVTSGVTGVAYSYDVDATAFPGPVDYSLDTAPSGMTINSDTGLIEWIPGASGVYDVAVRASSGTEPDAVEAFQVSVVTDTTNPSCALTGTGTDSNGKKFIEVTVQDAGSGLQSIEVTKSTNANVTWAPFDAGETDPVVVRGTKINNSKSSTVELRVTDVAGNVTVCDPVITLVVREAGKPTSQTHTGIPDFEHKVLVENGSPGLSKLDVIVNGKTWRLNGLKAGQVSTLDVASAMRPGNDNTFTLKAYGKPGASALVVISD